jgi:hypothetical protein
MEEELNVYDDLGLVAYYAQDLVKARELHSRLVRCLTEKNLFESLTPSEKFGNTIF